MTSTIVKPSGKKSLLIDGKAASAAVLERVAQEARTLGAKPGLAVVLVGEDAASQVYVKSKGKAALACGFHSVQHDLPAWTSEADPAIHGILVQLPLPAGIDSAKVLLTIAPEKDVDGFHPVNVGLLATGAVDKALVPCTPAGAMLLIEEAAKALGRDLTGAEAVIVGRSNIVGKPMAQLLLAKNATVTVAHSRTKDLPSVARRADILVAAVGRPEMIRGDWIKPGALVIDVGINRVPAEGVNAFGQPKTRLVGDVAFEEAVEVAGAITPVPGGVGPMTIALLMSNTLRAAKMARRL
jgi:methylenetetrahydrofolate dehydrogenase (NADP+)/methenyltetrahydrofolate cyclohydrolase